MLRSQKGSIYRVILAVLIGFAFCFALGWPQYSKYRNAAELSKAADIGKSLAFAEETYKEKHQTYTPQFKELELALPCDMVTQGPNVVMQCPHYTYQLTQDHIITAVHAELPVWLEIDIEQGTVECKYAQEDWAGKDLCARMQ